jgi:hypothetical protein
VSVQQAGKLKIEGVYTLALFRCGKCYLLRNLTEFDLDEMIRFKGAPRRDIASFDQRLFSQDPEENTAVLRTTAMRPTAGLEMSLLTESRILSHSLNLKRFAPVRIPHLLATALR